MIIAFDKNKFYAYDLDATLIFNVDQQGKVSGVTKIQNSEMTAKKISDQTQSLHISSNLVGSQ